MSGLDSGSSRNWLRTSLVALAAVIALTIVFGAGFWMGRRSAMPFDPSRPQARVAPRHGHGATGTIQEIAEPRIVIRTRDGKLQTIVVDADTRFDKNFQNISMKDLKINDTVIVLGSPDSEDQITARLVGLIDPSMPFRGFPSPVDSR